MGVAVDGAPTSANIVAFEAPRADEAFMLVHSPWGGVSEQPVVVAKS